MVFAGAIIFFFVHDSCILFITFLGQSRSELELQNIEVASTSDAVSFITYVQALKRNLKIWESQVRFFKLLEYVNILLLQ